MRFHSTKPSKNISCNTRTKQKRKSNYKSTLKSTEHYSRFPTEKRKKGELTFVALDSCIIFDMVKMLTGKTRKDSLYHKCLKTLLDLCAYRADGTRNPNGKYVFCITPSVQKEMPHKNGHIDAELKYFLDKRVVSLEVDFEHSGKFMRKANQLIDEYARTKIFLDDKGNVVADTRHIAEASLFNLTLISGDKLIIKNFHEKNPEEKIEKLKHINRKVLGGDFDGYQAIPRSPRSALGVIANGKRLSAPENLTITTPETQSKIFNELNFKIRRDRIRNIL